MNSQADEKFPGRSYAKDLENRQLGLEKEGRGLQENYYKKKTPIETKTKIRTDNLIGFMMWKII